MTDFVEALATRAADEGLLDVAYATLDSPVGELVVAATDRGLVRIGLPGEPLDSVLAALSRLPAGLIRVMPPAPERPKR